MNPRRTKSLEPAVTSSTTSQNVSSRGATALYSPDLLALAVTLADYPLDPSHTRQAEARSRTCGSVVAISLEQDEAGRIGALGLQVSACAVGQCAAALFAQAAVGRNASDIAAMRDAIAGWIAGGEMPGWPGLAVLTPALAHKGRHAAILLPWEAAASALSNPPAPD